MQIYLPSCSVSEIGASGSQCLLVEFVDESKNRVAQVEISLNAALAISEFLQENMKNSPNTKSGWELK